MTARRALTYLALTGLAAIALAVLVWAAIGLRATPKSGVAIIGDEAPLLLERTGLSQALPLSSAAVTVVSVIDWIRLGYVSDMSALCGAVCTGDLGVVRILRLAPGGSDKVVILNHENLDALEDRGCLVATIRAEIASLGAPETLPECAQGIPTRTLWSLPLGLGTF